MKLCDYGCGQEAKHQFKNGKWCCSENWHSCPFIRNKNSEIMKGKNTGPQSEEHKRKRSKSMKGKNTDPLSEEHKKKISESHKDKPLSEETKRKISKSHKDKPLTEEHKKNISNSNKFTLKDYKEKYPFFCSIEELRENKNGEIQAHCKNHECENSKEKGGWFNLTIKQITDRKNNLENEGEDKSYFYCSQHCKDTCILFGLSTDPYKNTNKPYTSGELDIFNKLVLKRDNEICYYCGDHHATIVHHLKPQKLEPFFALDPDYAISVCKKCHYKYGHPTGSPHSTGNLAKIVCSVESQKFLNQKNKKGK